jgi:beta-fructofuranosidase
MKKIPVIAITLFLFIISCNQATDTLSLVSSGVPGPLIETGEDWRQEDGFLESNGEYFIAVEQGIPSGPFQMSIRMELENTRCFLALVVGDNRFGFDGIGEEMPAGIVLGGPSFHKTHRKGILPAELIPVKEPFNLLVKYVNSLLEYSIDGKQVFSEKVVNEPFGRIRLEGWGRGKYIRIYDWTLDGDLAPLDEIYTKERLLARAQKSVDLRAEEVKDDPNRPIYHLQPPANWNNDPNGTLYYNGYYHMFYQHNPFADHWDWMHWGHMRSKDLVTWEHLPIALWPSLEKGEEHCFSGSAIVNSMGEPMLFYTSIGHEAPEQWVAIPADDELISWEKHPANPILQIDDHKGEVIEQWRDPQLIHEGDQTLMVVGGHPDGMGGSIMLYKALNDELTEWDYLGTAFSGNEENWECPNFFRVGNKWVVIYSPHGQVMYYTGNFNLETYQFEPEQHGGVDFGNNFYAPNTMEDGKGRRLLWGWIPGFKEDQGWQGAITIPRNLTVSPEGWLIQEPVDELVGLRGENRHVDSFMLEESTMDLDVPGHEFELIARLSNLSASAYGLRLNLEEVGEIFEISLSGSHLYFGEEEISLAPFKLGKDLSFRLFCDRTIIELYLNGGLVCATSVVYPDKENPGWELFAEGGRLELESLDIWKMKRSLTLNESFK